MAKNMPFRTKKQLFSKDSQMISKLNKQPSSVQKFSCSSTKQQTYISAQKSEDGKIKLFRERRVSQNNCEFPGSQAISAAAAEVSLRMKTQNTLIGSGSNNVSRKSSTALNTHLSKLQHQRSSGSLKTSGVQGLRINSSKQEIIHTSQSKTNYTTTNVDYKTRLQSKYGINAQNKMIASGQLNGGAPGSNQKVWRRTASNGHILERKSF